FRGQSLGHARNRRCLDRRASDTDLLPVERSTSAAPRAVRRPISAGAVARAFGVHPHGFCRGRRALLGFTDAWTPRSAHRGNGGGGRGVFRVPPAAPSPPAAPFHAGLAIRGLRGCRCEGLASPFPQPKRNPHKLTSEA